MNIISMHQIILGIGIFKYGILNITNAFLNLQYLQECGKIYESQITVEKETSLRWPSIDINGEVLVKFIDNKLYLFSNYDSRFRKRFSKYEN